MWGIGAVAAALTAAAPWLSRSWRRAGWALLVGMMVTAFMDSPVSFALARRRRRRMGVGRGRARGARERRRGARRRRPSSTGSRSVGLPLQRLDRRASTPAGRRRTSVWPRAATSCSSRRSARTSAAPICCSASTGGSSPATSATRSRSPRCGVPSSTRRSSRSRHETCRVRTPRAAGVRHGRPERVRPGLRRDRGQVPRPPRPERGHRRRAGGDLANSSASCVERRIAHRDLRLANIFVDDAGEVWLIDFGFSEMAASDLLLATDVAELLASSSLYVGPERAVAHAVRTRRPGDAVAGAATGCARGRSPARRGPRSSPGRACSTSCAAASPLPSRPAERLSGERLVAGRSPAAG